MSEKKPEKTNLILGYIYKKINPYFWDNVLAAKDFFQEIFVFNCTDEPLSSSDLSIKIINESLENYPAFLADNLYNKRYQADFLLILEDTEKILFMAPAEDIFSGLKDDRAYNIPVEPIEYEVFDYETEPFTTSELRLFSLKMRDFKEILAKGDFFHSAEANTLKSLVIRKKEADADFDILKVQVNEKEEMSSRKHFFLGVAYFYKDSNLSETNLLKVLENNDEDRKYQETALSLLLKLLFRRQDYDGVLDMAEKYNELADRNPLTWFYQGLAHFEFNFSVKALNAFHKSIKLRENLPLIYNFSDLNWKLYGSLAWLFYSIQRLKNAEKYFVIADQLMNERKSPALYLSLAKIKFLNQDYDASFDIFSKLFALENISPKVLKAAKQTFLNLLLFIDFKDEFIDSLSREYFDKPEEILRVADTFYMNENYVEALKIYLLVVKKFGADNKLLFKLGYICSKLRILDQGCKYFEMYLEKEPEDLDALNNLAFLYMNMDKLDLAEKTYLKVLKLNNYSFEANLHLAIIFVSLKNKARAKQYLDKAKTLNPVSPEVIKLYKIFTTEFK